MERYEVLVTGLTPLLMHNNNLEARDAIAARGRQGGKAGDDRHPADTWKASLYVDEERVCIPAENFLAALLKAGSGVSIGRMKTLKAASQSMLFSEFYVPLLVGSDGHEVSREDIDAIDGTYQEQATAVKQHGFSLFTKPCNVNGKSHVRVRPRFDTWSARLEFQTDNEDLLGGTNRLQTLWDGAGRAGVGDWRPSAPKKPGMYGVFSASVKKIK